MICTEIQIPDVCVGNILRICVHTGNECKSVTEIMHWYGKRMRSKISPVQRRAYDKETRGAIQCWPRPDALEGLAVTNSQDR